MSEPPARTRLLAARVAVLGLVVAGALGPSWPGPPRAAPPLLALDVSASVGRGSLDPDDEAFAGRERLVFADGVRFVARGEDPSDLPRERSRLAEALAAAGERLGPAGGAVWLVTDGRDTEGGALAAARALAGRGIRLYVSAPSPARVDTAIASVRVEGVAADGALSVVVRVASSVSGRVRVVLRRGAQTADQREVDVAPGAVAEVRLSDDAPGEPGTPREVSLTPLAGTPDDDPANDRVAIAAAVGERFAVVLDPEPWPTLDPGGPRVRDASDVTPAEVEAADVLVVSNWRRITDAGADRLARFVAGGGRLLVLGGPDAYGPGGWRGTAFERLLPLRSKPPEDGGVDVVLAIDRSGSTGERPEGGGPQALEALASAVVSLLDALPPDAHVLVLPFADRPDAPLAPGWAPAGDAGRRATLRASVRALASGGGTDLDRAITAAAGELRTRTVARRRTVIVLTDGDPDHALDAASLAGAREALAAARAGFHAVVRGDGTAAAALATLAASPDDVALIGSAGRFAEALAKAFGRVEAGEEVRTGPWEVSAAGGVPDVEALGRGTAPERVHRLQATPDARVLSLAAHAHDAERLPFAATRALGAGRVVAVAWGPALEPAARRAAARAALSAGLQALADEADRGLAGDVEDGRLTVAAGSAWAGKGTARALARDPLAEGRADDSTLLETSPGVFVGPAPAGLRPDDVLFVEVEGAARRPVRVPTRPPPEHRGTGVDEAMLRSLAEAGGGRRLVGGERPPIPVVRTSVPLGSWLLLAALLLFVAERALVLGRVAAPGSGRDRMSP